MTSTDKYEVTGQTITHYRVGEKLGEGASAIVYRAEDLSLGRQVVLKFFSAGGPESVARLQHEARTISSINHPNICTIYEIGEHGGRHFMAMEMLEGGVLSEALGGRPPNLERLIDIGTQIADALQAAHAEQIVHRDLKPANIFVTRSGRIKLLDFGVAILRPRRSVLAPPGLRSTSRGGTIPYMSPEQAQAEDVDHRSDLFSLGIVLYEMATGRHPFAAATGPDTLSAIVNYTATTPRTLDPRIPSELERILMKALEKNAALRYQSASDLKADLLRLKRDLDATESGRAASTQHVGTSIRWPRWRLTAAATALLIAGGGWFIWRTAKPRPILSGPSGQAGSSKSLADPSLATVPALVVDAPSVRVTEPTIRPSPTLAPVNRVLIARRQIDLRLYDQAIDTLRAVANADNGQQALDAEFLIASIHDTRGDAANAMSTYLEIATRFSNTSRAPEALTKLAQWILKSQRPESERDGLRTLNAVVEKYPNSSWAARALLMRGDLEARQGTYQRDDKLGGSLPVAAATYRHLVERYPSSESAAAALDRLARLYVDAKRFADAAATFERLAARDADGRYDAWFAAAEIYDRRLKDSTRARAAYARVPPSSPHYAAALKRRR